MLKWKIAAIAGLAFGVAGIGMLAGLVQYVLGAKSAAIIVFCAHGAAYFGGARKFSYFAPSCQPAEQSYAATFPPRITRDFRLRRRRR